MSKKLLATALLPFAALAQDPSSINNDEVTVVTANRVEQAVSDVIAPISIITRDDIELTQAQSLTDVFRMLPGVDVAVNGGRGQTASVFVRGGESDHALVLIDGVRLVTSVSGFIDFNQIPINQVERIEFIRGARAAIYGSEAVSGVINIITKGGLQDSVSVSAGLGSNNYKTSNLYLFTNITENTSAKVTANFEATDGYNVKPYPGLNDGDEHGFESDSYSFLLNHKFNQNISGFAQLRYYQNTYEYVDTSTYNNNPHLGKKNEGQVENKSTTVGLKYKLNSLESSIQYSQSEQDDVHFSLVGSSPTFSYSSQYEQETLNWISNYVFNDHFALSGGLDWASQTLGEDTRDNKAVSLNLMTNVDTLSINTAVRTDDNEHYGTNTTWNIGAGWFVNPIVRLTANAGTAFKAPSLYELSPNSGNPELKPEESIGYETGVEVFTDLVNVSLQGYRNEVDNLIEYNYATYGYSNALGKNVLQGAELSLDFDTSIVSNTVSLEYLDAKDANGNDLVRRAKHKAKWQGIVSFNDIDWSLQYLYQGERFDINDVVLSSYSLWNLSAQYQITSQFKLSGRIENLLDKEYETVDGYPTPERGYYINASYEF
ncbi:TonB-dependent receptor [Moritella sp. 24]|uniref:TonB-dependent receptor domain-containing protein n=1 Tax=Moritella sp. 24 TaxID=2746230 RepID=UPI001BA5243E|nr:TonB-dependent receptor [Moritella sp. 24]QUM75056.1 TonB-dependent receptor [Moritella sp. 24]